MVVGPAPQASLSYLNLRSSMQILIKLTASLSRRVKDLDRDSLSKLCIVIWVLQRHGSTLASSQRIYMFRGS